MSTEADISQAKETFNALLLMLKGAEVEVLLHGLHKMVTSKNHKIYGSVNFDFQNGRLKRCDSGETFISTEKK